MKKTITLVLLLIGLMILGGCTSKTIDYSDNQQQTQQEVNSEPQQDQRQTQSSKISAPPALPEE